MISSKIIDNVNPFSDMRMDCFYNALFPSIVHFGKSVDPFLINYVFFYSYDKTLKPSMHIHECFKPHVLLDKMGLKFVRESVSSQEYIDIICKSILEDKLVITDIDEFCNPCSPTFGIRHALHNVLIYGFDHLSRKFNIIEHNWYDDFKYEKTLISYQDMLNCYEEYDRYYNKAYIRTIECKNKEDTVDITNNLKIYGDWMDIKNPLGLISKIFNSICEDLKNHIDNNEFLISTASNLSYQLGLFINNTSFECSGYSKMFDETSLLNGIASQLITNVGYARAILYKIGYTKKYTRNMIEKCISSLLVASDVEMEYRSKVGDILKSYQ